MTWAKARILSVGRPIVQSWDMNVEVANAIVSLLGCDDLARLVAVMTGATVGLSAVYWGDVNAQSNQRK